MKRRKKLAVLSEEEIIRMFKIPQDKSDKWHERLVNADKKSFYKMIRFSRVFPIDQAIDVLINNFTFKDTTNEEFVDYARRIKSRSRGKILEIKRVGENAGFTIISKEGKISAVKVYEQYPNVLEFMPTMDNIKRDGKCHFHALQFSTLLTLSGIENEVVSAYVFEFAKKEEYSHSWVEFKSEKGTPLVFDGNRGAIITRDGYYRIKHPRDISRISSRDIICEQTIIRPLQDIADSWATKLYFHDREMALKVYEKHFGRPFVPKDYDYAIEHPETIIQLDEINKQSEKQPEN